MDCFGRAESHGFACEGQTKSWVIMLTVLTRTTFLE